MQTKHGVQILRTPPEILVAFLRDLAAEGREPTELELTRMGDMIRVSDNYSASYVFDRLSPDALDPRTDRRPRRHVVE